MINNPDHDNVTHYMTQVSQLQWGTHSDCDGFDVQSSGDNKFQARQFVFISMGLSVTNYY